MLLGRYFNFSGLSMQVIHLSYREEGAAFAHEILLAELIEIGLAVSTLR